MILRWTAVLAMVLMVRAETASVLTTSQAATSAAQAAQKIDAKELAFVERIRARIDERAGRPRPPELSRNQHDAARGEQVRRVAEREDGRVLPVADGGRMGIRVPSEHGCAARSIRARRVRMVRRQLTDEAVPRRHLSHGRHEE